MSVNERPFVSLVMPAYKEELYIEKCLESLLNQDYPADRVEILVADGGSPDKTREIVNRISETHPCVRLLDNSEHRIQCYGMNIAIQASRGELILVVDAHAKYAGDYVNKLVEVFERTGADAAGGAMRADYHTWFQKALCAALDSPLGVGGAAYRSAEKEGWVDVVFPGAFRRSTLEKVGLYDTNAIDNEDSELFQRISEAGGKVYLSRDVVVHYYPRRNLRLLFKQYFKYGGGRARTLIVHRGLAVVRPLIPFLSVVTGLTLLIVPALRPIAPYVFGAYGALTLLEAIRVGRKAGWWAIPVVWSIFWTLHLSHGLGMMTGLVRYFFKPLPSNVERLKPAASAGETS
ncbi:MAG: glycosyltransferase family 2 protein [Planctomycetales bacterium]